MWYNLSIRITGAAFNTLLLIWFPVDEIVIHIRYRPAIKYWNALVIAF
jgi:hypothetical protein